MKAVILEGKAVNPGDISWVPFTDLVHTIIYENTTEQDKWEKLADCDIVITNKVIMDDAVFTRFPQIRYVGVNATGYNVVDLEAASRHGVVVTNIPAYSTDSVVQMTWAMILELASKVSLHNNSVHNGDWIHADTFTYWKAPVVELSGKVLGIYGFGNIGRGVAKAALAFGMKVLVHTAHPEKYVNQWDNNVQFVDENTLFTKSDVLSFHCPLTSETTGIVNRQTLSSMKSGAYLINVSRGGIVIDKDLTEALQNHVIAGAALDVISTEPMEANSPLLTAPNLIITPHIAWASIEARSRLVEISAHNLKAWMNGNPQNQVNL